MSKTDLIRLVMLLGIAFAVMADYLLHRSNKRLAENNARRRARRLRLGTRKRHE